MAKKDRNKRRKRKQQKQGQGVAASLEQMDFNGFGSKMEDGSGVVRSLENISSAPLQNPSQVAVEQMQNIEMLDTFQNEMDDGRLEAIRMITEGTENLSRSDAQEIMRHVNHDLNGAQEVNVNSFLAPDVIVEDLESSGLMMPNAQNLVPDGITMEQLTRTDYFPNIDDRILQGQFQSQTLGSVPIFAAGGLNMPLEVFNARQRALENAATKRREERDAIMLAAQAKGAVQYQNQIDDMVFNHLDSWGQKYNYDWRALQSDPKAWMEYQRDLKQIQDFAAETVRIDGIVNTIYTESTEEKKFVPGSVKQTAIDWSSAVVDLHALRDDPKKLSAMRRELDSYSNMVYTINQAVPSIQTNIEAIMLDELDKLDDAERVSSADKLFSTIKNTEDAQLVGSAMLEFLPKERVLELARQLRNNGGSFYQTEEDFANYLGNLFGSKVTVTDRVWGKYNDNARMRVDENKPKTTTEGIFAEKRNFLWDEKTKSVSQGFTDFVTGFSGNDKEFKEAWHRFTETVNDPNDPYLRADLQLNTGNWKPIRVTGADPGYRMEWTDEAGNQSWKTFDQFHTALKDKYGSFQQEAMAIANSSDDQKDKDEEIAKLKENIIKEHGNKGLAEYAYLGMMDKGPNMFSQTYRPSGASYEMQYKDGEQYWLAEAEDVNSGVIQPNELAPFATVTLSPVQSAFQEFKSALDTDQQGDPIIRSMKIEVVNSNLPQAMITYDLRGEGAQTLDAIVGRENIQQHRDDRGRSGLTPVPNNPVNTNGKIPL